MIILLIDYSSDAQKYDVSYYTYVPYYIYF